MLDAGLATLQDKERPIVHSIVVLIIDGQDRSNEQSEPAPLHV